MDDLSKDIEYENHIYIPYSIEKLDDMSYIVFYLENKKGKELSFLTNKNFPNPHVFKGCINWNETSTSYLFYELEVIEREFLKAEEEDLWKVTPYEILYTRMVTDLPIHTKCVDFFKAFPSLFFVEDNEVPIVTYIGVGVSELNEQILLQNKNEKKGILGKGYYFTTYENAEYDALYKENDDDLIRLENKLSMSDKDFQDTSVYIKDHYFYHHSYKLGKVPRCNESLNYFIYYYDQEVIYLKSKHPHACKIETETQVKLRKEDGCVMRYVLFLKKHFIGKSKGYDSYAYDSHYMIRHSDHFICLSYHSIKKK
jgi:hypothetical protein